MRILRRDSWYLVALELGHRQHLERSVETFVRIDRISTSSPRPDSQTWVDASIPRKPLLDWRELVINGLHYSGTLHLARRAFEVPRNSSGWWVALATIPPSAESKVCDSLLPRIGESGNPLIAAPTREGFEAQMRFRRRNYRIVSWRMWVGIERFLECRAGSRHHLDDG